MDIAKIGRRLARAQQVYQPLADIPRLAHLSRVMLQDALQAFIHHDLNLVEKVIRDDDEVDRLYHAMRERLTKALVENPSNALLALNILFAAKYLERVSDHVVNVAERVWFVETGELKPAREFLNRDDSP